MNTVSAYIEALKTGSLDAVRALIAQHPDLPQLSDEKGISLLLWACYYEQPLIAEELLKYKSQLNVYEAAAVGNLEELERNMAENPALLNSFAPDGFTPLGLACFFEREVVAHWLVNHGADVNLASDNSFRVKPIHSSVARKNLMITQMLILYGADVNATQSGGLTALHTAAHQADADIAQMLIQHEADMYATTESGKTPYDFAHEADAHEILALLKTYSTNY